MKTAATIIKAPYRFRQTDGTIFYDYRSAHTRKNPKWKWWKFWKERFISIPAGYQAKVFISGNIELDIKPTWIGDWKPENIRAIVMKNNKKPE